MRREASVLHLDLDAFFASVEQRDKPSLRGRPVVVGGLGQRGVVATASYQARVFGVRSAMPVHEARRRCPQAAFLAGRFDAYRQSSAAVMRVLRELAPLVEPLSLDEAYVDLQAADHPPGTDPDLLVALASSLRTRVSEVTGGLTGSVGIASSKFMAKVASELAKPGGIRVVEPGTEARLLAPMSVRLIPGVGPVTFDKLQRVGLRTVADLQSAPPDELVRVVGRAAGETLAALAYGRDDRRVEAERETKSISVEDTFETDLVLRSQLETILVRQAAQVATRLRAARLFARTVTLKVRRHDFATHTRSQTFLGGTDRTEVITRVARGLLAEADLSGGIRLLGVGLAGLTEIVQEDLFGPGWEVPAADGSTAVGDTGHSLSDDITSSWAPAAAPLPWSATWIPGCDVEHSRYGRGWVWGAGRGRVTVRFETRHTAPGPVRTFPSDDPDLSACPPLPLPGALPDSEPGSAPAC